MRFSYEVDYAFRIIEYFSSKPEHLIKSKELSTELEIPLRFTLKILNKLVDSGLVKSKRGVTGGYHLSNIEEPNSLYDVVVAIIGDIAINRCLEDNSYCFKNDQGCGNKCMVHYHLNRIQNVLVEELKKSKFTLVKKKL